MTYNNLHNYITTKRYLLSTNYILNIIIKYQLKWL